MYTPDLPIATERLTLRAYESRDLDVLADIRRRPEVMRYLYEEPQTREEVEATLARHMRRIEVREVGAGLVLAVELGETRALIGDVSLLWTSDEHRQGEIGFIFHPDAQGQGYAREAAQAMLRIGFDGMSLHRIAGRCDARNTGSARLMERLGMRQEAHLRENEWFKGAWGDELVFAILAREWAEAR